ncbi:hypothetical protein KUV85_08065 [Nocardioides panacisoli]|uniref:hypothetical protein n=1 Tax=Nocardioides panacisoli TaxID=627624 RepID=UPI001C636721|nr:hypothetical protein [Nocardioides panacisoli]QYJ05621.1 hypothetical protein KUV85_08065 [Nocardioides panacisoli]
MTTDSPLTRPLPGSLGADPQVRAVLWVGLGCAAVGAGAAVLGGLLVGPSAARGAGVGTAMALGIFLTGALVVAVVSRLLPAAALLVALVTYAGQVVLAVAVFARLQGSEVLVDGTLDAGWLAGVMVACTLLWMGVQVRTVATRRELLFDLTEGGVR